MLEVEVAVCSVVALRVEKGPRDSQDVLWGLTEFLSFLRHRNAVTERSTSWLSAHAEDASLCASCTTHVLQIYLLSLHFIVAVLSIHPGHATISLLMAQSGWP